MRALLPHCMAALTAAAIACSAAAPAAARTAEPVRASFIAASCPAGTHWDHILQMCISN